MKFTADTEKNLYCHKTNTLLLGGWVGNKPAWILPGGRITQQAGTAKRALQVMARLSAKKC